MTGALSGNDSLISNRLPSGIIFEYRIAIPPALKSHVTVRIFNGMIESSRGPLIVPVISTGIIALIRKFWRL